MSDILAEFGLPNGIGDAKEWAGGLKTLAGVTAADEARKFIRWAMDQAREEGRSVEHWRHVRQFADVWRRAGEGLGKDGAA